MTAKAHVDETTKAQRLAAEPSISAFVSANAGAGKTRVLTNRVARLLLDGVDPATILCITYTKAAAAEMADRLFKLLGDWALSGDAALQKALTDLDGNERRRSAQEVSRARRLFARALETPGGLKIQTIHSFCEGVLKRFPLEAGVAPGFSVIEELEADKLRRESVSRVAAFDGAEIAPAFARLLAQLTGGALRELLERCLAERRAFKRAAEIGWRRLGGEVAAALGAPDEDSTTIADRLFDSLPRNRLEDAHAALYESDGKPRENCAAPLKAYLGSTDRRQRLDALGRLFCGSNGAPRQSFGTKATAAIDPSIEDFLKGAQKIYLDFIDRIRAADARDDTLALFAILERCFADYSEAKAARAALDFDDLIDLTGALFRADGAAAWVLYKLDMGLAHVLLDEAQDTGPDAWNVIEAPLEEFFAGAGAEDRLRTFFAVGDQKQSIYSFQGADAALFEEKKVDLGKKISAARAYKDVLLKASFRSTAPPLRFVDAAFAPDAVIDNVSAVRPLKHWCTRAGEAGFVELWPLVQRAEKQTVDPWDAPLDATPADSPPKRLASEIAGLISDWLRNRETLESQGRPIEPADILILVQTRGPLFDEMIRALGMAGVLVAGADKLRLMEDQGVLDLVSYARAVLFEGDDLSLAETLKSPFFGLSEDSLYDLAANRAHARLWRTLRERSGERADWRRAREEISAARRVALADGAAAFLTHVLETGSPSGWRRLAGRLGASCREPIEELLRQAHEFETRRPRSLRLFLDALVKSGAEISRDSSEAGAAVRVMTVHKAKGLEAPIVFLIDAHRPAATNMIGPLLAIEGAEGIALPALVLGDAKEGARAAAARARAKRLARDEYRRLFYVASTRAKDRLYICGHQHGRGDPTKPPPAEKSWHALANDAFGLVEAEIVDSGEKFGGIARRLACPQTAAITRRVRDASPAAEVCDLGFLSRPAEAETRPKRLSPSRLLDEGPGGSPYSPSGGAAVFLRGRIIHRLLELLPKIARDGREDAADRLLKRHEGYFGGDELQAMRAEVFRVLTDEKFAEVFAPDGLSEAAIGGRLGGALLSGRIDRLAILGTRVLAVDYKSNRPPPARIEDVPAGYLVQMAAYRELLRKIYPGRAILTALLWTFDARLMALPDEALDRALELTLA